MESKEKFQSMIIDGQIVDLNSISYEKMDEIQEKLEKRQNEIRRVIDKILEERR